MMMCSREGGTSSTFLEIILAMFLDYCTETSSFWLKNFSNWVKHLNLETVMKVIFGGCLPQGVDEFLDKC